MSPTLSSTIAAAGKTFRHRFAALVVYEIYFRLLSAAALGPLIAGLLAYLISSSGQLAIGNEQIVGFVCSPVGIVGGLLLGGLWSAMIFAEHVGLMAIGLSVDAGQPLSATAALVRMLRKGPGVIQLGLLYFAGFAVLAMPFVAMAGGAYWFLLSDRDINFYLAEKPPKFMLALAIGGGLAIGLAAAWAVLYVRWMFSLPILLIENLSPWICLRESANVARGRFFRCGLVPLVWLLLIGGVSLLSSLLLDLFDDFMLRLPGDRFAAAVVATLLVVAVELFIGVALSFVGLAVHCLLIARLYHDLRGSITAAGSHASTDSTADSPPEFGRGKQRLLAWLSVAACLITAMVLTYSLLGNLSMNDQVEITAHRGSSIKAPENTMAAFKQAIADGADFIELDVQETADGQLAVLHDADLMRIAGLNRGIWEVTYDEVKDLDIGSRGGPQFSGERLATLGQVIELVRGKAKLNIELKFNGHEERLVERVVELVQQEKFGDQCVITSLKYDGVAAVKRRDPALKVGYIIAQSIGDATKLDVDLLSVNHNRVTDALIYQATAGNKAVHAWTVNDRATASTMIDRGVDNLITDDPVMIRDLLRERAELSNVERAVLAVRSFLGR